MTKPTILNTRPIDQINDTHSILSEHGFGVIDFPCIEIALVDDQQDVLNSLKEIQVDDVIIFTSQNAVRYTFKIHPDWLIPKNAIVIAVGSKTAHVLEQNSHCDIWVPEKQNSLGVIDLLKGLKKCDSIKLITAQGGRTQIQNYAKSSDIPLTQINVYQRKTPQVNKQSLVLIENTESLFILASSTTTLINMQKLVPNYLWEKLKPQTLLCSSNRIVNKALELGFKKTINVNTANPEKITKILLEGID